MNLNYRVVIRQLGLLLFVLSALIGAVGLFGVVDRWGDATKSTGDVAALFLTAFVGLVVGGLFHVSGRRMSDTFGQREALLLVALSWILGAGLAALPFRLWAISRADAAIPHQFDQYVNCYFEAMSGFTTSGATVVESLATLPRSILLWRSLTQWLGGLGIVVLFVAVLPMLGVGSRRVFMAEAAGPSPEGVKPRIRDTARILWMIYLGLTVAETLALKVSGMGWFDALCHTMTTLATGGFSTQDASIAAFPSIAMQVIIIVFMVLAGINFGLYHQLLQGGWRGVRKDPELRCYLVIILAATAIVTFSIMRTPDADRAVGFADSLHHSLFQVVSIQTTTGFCSADFDTWGFAAKATLFALMFIGGSAGSTSGGIKVVRVLIVAKILLAEIEHAYRPKVVRPIKIGKGAVETDMKLNTLVFFVGFILAFSTGTIFLMLFEADNGIDITTAASASVTVLSNIGPGLAKVGATQNYAWFTASGKIVLSALMLLGRLEMFTLIVLFSPRFWRTE